MYHLVRIVVCLVAAALWLNVVRLIAREVVRTGDWPALTSFLAMALFSTFPYLAWYINAGQRRIHFWLANAALVAWVCLMCVAAMSDDRSIGDIASFGLVLSVFALGVWLRQPRIRAIALRKERLLGNWNGLVPGLADRSAFVRRRAAKLLGDMSPDALGALPELNKSRYDSSASVRRAARDAAVQIETKTLPLPSSATLESDNPYRSPLA